jgi:hypothetical protein
MTTESRSVFHRCANASLWCLAAAIIANMLLGPIARVAAGEGATWAPRAFAATIGLVMFAGVALGAVALCGIPRYGKRRLLWKGLVGLLVPILLVGSAILAFNTVRQKSLERARQRQSSPPSEEKP